MPDYLIKEETLTNIADAIRTKIGKSEDIIVSNMANEINNIDIDGAIDAHNEDEAAHPYILGELTAIRTEHNNSVNSLNNTIAANATAAENYTNSSVAGLKTELTTGSTIVKAATADGSGNVITTTYETKADASTKLAEAKTYADTAISNLINGAPTTLDTLGEIATAMEENENVVDALNTAIGTKANSSDLTSHVNNKSNPHSVTLAQLGITATAAELNKMDGVTATASEINKLDGLTATTTELNYVDGVTSNIQTQLNGKASTSAATTSAAGLMSAADKTKLNGIATGANAYSLPTASSSTLGGVKTTSTVTSTSGLTACPIISGVPYYKDTNTTYSLSSFGVTATAAELNKLDGVTATTAELNYVDGVTSNIQTQLNNKAASSHNHAASNITSGTLSSDRLPTVPISKGGTGATTAAAARTNLGITLANLGITATAAELNKLDGVTTIFHTGNKADYVSFKTTATIPVSGWLNRGGDEGYYQQMAVTGILAADKPVVGLVCSGTVATDRLLKEDWNKISRIDCGANVLTIYAYDEVPTVNLPIQITCVR